MWLNLLSLFWPFYQLSEVSIQLPFRLYFIDFLVILTLLGNWRQIVYNHHPLQKPVALFVFWCLLSLALSISTQHPDNNIIIRSTAYLFRLICYLSITFTPLVHDKYLKIGLVTAVLISLGQYVFIPDLHYLKELYYDDHFYRLTFPTLDPNYSGALLILSMAVLVHFKKPFNIVFLILASVAIVLTFSRASYLCAIVGFIHLFYRQHKSRALSIYLPMIVILGLMIVLLAPKPAGEGVNLFRTYSVVSRLSNWQQSITTITKHPIFGVGYNTLGSGDQIHPLSRSAASVSNSYLFVAQTTGVIGLLLFIRLLLSYYRYIRPNKYLPSIFFALALHAFFNNTLFYAPIFIGVALLTARENNLS